MHILVIFITRLHNYKNNVIERLIRSWTFIFNYGTRHNKPTALKLFLTILCIMQIKVRANFLISFILLWFLKQVCPLITLLRSLLKLYSVSKANLNILFQSSLHQFLNNFTYRYNIHWQISFYFSRNISVFNKYNFRMDNVTIYILFLNFIKIYIWNQQQFFLNQNRMETKSQCIWQKWSYYFLLYRTNKILK